MMYEGLGALFTICDGHAKDHRNGMRHGDVVELYEDRFVKVVCNAGTEEMTGKPFREPFIYAEVSPSTPKK